MLTLLLSAHDGGTAWRHLLAPGEARAGFEVVGPLGLARRLGRILGYPSQPAEAPDRLAAFAQRLDSRDDGSRSYSASKQQDRFGVARFLFALRDALLLAGWDGRKLGGSGRLDDLLALEALGSPLPPGLPDVLLGLLSGLTAAGKLPFPIRIDLTEPRRAFAPLVLRLLDALVKAGAEVRDAAPPTALAPKGTDLGRLQRALLDPTSPRPMLEGDGSFLLLEADTPAEAAELTASLARTRPLGDATFVVATEATALDTAFARQGLPTPGFATSSPLRPHLQVLPLRLALALRPQDPFRAAELLLLPGAPLPGHARRALLDALNEMPGIGGPAWREAVEEAVQREHEWAAARGDKAGAAKAASEKLRERIDDWFGGELYDSDPGIPASKAAALCAQVATWAGGRVKGAIEAGDAQTGEDVAGSAADADLWSHAAAVARTLERLLLARPAGERLTPIALMQLHDVAVGAGSDLSAFAGEAGRPALASSPAMVTAPCAEALWWGFVADADPGPLPEPWTAAERQALSAAGVSLPAPGERRAVEAEGWRRPLLAARERAVLVRWRLAGAEPAAPHPFLDELTTRLADGALRACTVTSEAVLGGTAPALWKAATTPVAPLAPLGQRPVWKVPSEALASAAALSSTSLESFLSCPFRWALEYQARLRPGAGTALPEGNQLLGDFAHRILQDMLCGTSKLPFAGATPEAAEAWALNAFDSRVALEAAPLVQPGADVARARARTLVGDAAAALVRVLQQAGWRPVDAEREVQGTFSGRPTKGFVDLVVERRGKEALVDLKLGRSNRREQLEKGRALQLALYASMLRKGGDAVPPSSFFVLQDGQLLTSDPQAFPGATVVEGPGSQATLRDAEELFRYWRRVLDGGLLPALRDGLAWEELVAAAAGPRPEGEPFGHEKRCDYCDFNPLCALAAPAEDAL